MLVHASKMEEGKRKDEKEGLVANDECRFWILVL